MLLLRGSNEEIRNMLLDSMKKIFLLYEQNKASTIFSYFSVTERLHLLLSLSIVRLVRFFIVPMGIILSTHHQQSEYVLFDYDYNEPLWNYSQA
jgi:hypothetical protein